MKQLIRATTALVLICSLATPVAAAPANTAPPARHEDDLTWTQALLVGCAWTADWKLLPPMAKASHWEAFSPDEIARDRGVGIRITFDRPAPAENFTQEDTRDAFAGWWLDKDHYIGLALDERRFVLYERQAGAGRLARKAIRLRTCRLAGGYADTHGLVEDLFTDYRILSATLKPQDAQWRAVAFEGGVAFIFGPGGDHDPHVSLTVAAAPGPLFGGAAPENQTQLVVTDGWPNQSPAPSGAVQVTRAQLMATIPAGGRVLFDGLPDFHMMLPDELKAVGVQTEAPPPAALPSPAPLNP